MLFGSADTDVSFSVEDLGSQWMGPTPRPRLRARPCAPLGIPMNMMNTTCGTLYWTFLCHVQVGVFLESYFDEVVLGRIALSCHFALDILCDEEEMHAPSGTMTDLGFIGRFAKVPVEFGRNA